MKTLILDGSHANDPMGVRVNSILQKNLEARGLDSETIILREKKIGNCAGDFLCWIRTPGICNVDDDNREIAVKIVESDLLIYLTPVTFGGYSSVLKRMQDHQIQNILPFFTTINGEIHHQKRYTSYPRVLTIGWLDSPQANAEAIFRNLAYHNSLNMYSSSSICGIVYGDQRNDELIDTFNQCLTQTEHGIHLSRPALPDMDVSHSDTKPPHCAVLLNGSPRTSKGTSAALGGYLFEKMNECGVESKTIHWYSSINSPERMKQFFATLDMADLVVLAFPLYVDSLPAPVISMLEQIADHRKGKFNFARFAAIANCGFPESRHNETALAICSEFTHSAGFEWMGSLALGGGEGLVHGTPLNELDGRALPIKKSLEIAAEALVAGKPIPESALELMAKPSIPNWLYRFIGTWGWKQQARRYDAQNRLRSRPYQGTHDN